MTAINKTATRLAEALWISFKPAISTRSTATDDIVDSGWRLRYFDSSRVQDTSAATHQQMLTPRTGTRISPTDVVAHGAVHLHALGVDGSVVHTSSTSAAAAGQETAVSVHTPGLELVSLDVPIVSAGLLSPFPTALDNSTADNSTGLINSWIGDGGWRYNLANNIW